MTANTHAPARSRPAARRPARAAVAEPPAMPAENVYISPTVPFEEIEARFLADPAIRAAYDALEPAYQIASLRIKAGLTQAQLAELVGTKQPSIARLERGQQQPTIEFLRRLGKALGYRLELNFVPVEQ